MINGDIPRLFCSNTDNLLEHPVEFVVVVAELEVAIVVEDDPMELATRTTRRSRFSPIRSFFAHRQLTGSTLRSFDSEYG